jgi:hypothetical protein
MGRLEDGFGADPQEYGLRFARGHVLRRLFFRRRPR